MKEKTQLAFDANLSKRWKDENGFLHVSDCHITKEQVVPYRGIEIPDWDKFGLDPHRIYMGYRPGSEIEKAKNTFNGLPLMLLHHEVSAENPNKEYQVGTLGTNAEWRAPYLDNSLVITDAVGIHCVENNTCKEISLSYRYDPVIKSGEYQGVPYDFVMRNLRGNHAALVEKGRAGSEVVVADSALTKTGGNFMHKLLKLFKGANDADPELQKEVIGLARDILKQDTPAAEVAKDEDKGAKINAILAMLGDKLTDEEKAKLKNSLSDLAYSDASGESEIARKVDKTEAREDANDADPEETEKLEEVDELVDGILGKKYKREDVFEEEAEDEDLPSTLDPKALDALRQCGMDEESDAVKAAFTKGFSWGMKDGEADMRDPGERKKLDREHERRAMEKLLAKDSAETIRKVEKSIESKYAAAADVAPVIGKVQPLAFDSAADIYMHALKSMGKNASKGSAREVFKAIVETYSRKMAMDCLPADVNQYTGSFAGLSNIKV